VARERIGYGRKELHALRMRGGVAEDDERIAADHLAVEDAGAIEAGRLDTLEERHQFGQRRGAGHAHVDTDRFGHALLLV
jgi:hypothetical protein